MSKPQVAFTLDDDVDGIVDTAIERILAENRGRCAYCGSPTPTDDSAPDLLPICDRCAMEHEGAAIRELAMA
ncbi:hypothetical protein BMIN_0463 [Bifidobacterium minimum]|uniref:Uncharacterized protein n=1 Tax=Bifidobacterium minimum TaxID=1693 RepID=A0A087BNG5_9BIFI|nr:hypothetical protein [Bifidobacterium minimum]KFI72565.1 hypothetical protein BMIN_0463 [Bifidobacterium minimum]